MLVSMDHQAVAAVSLAGIFLDVLGGLYLAYDLLGGQHGPLRLLTRAVTYSIVFGVGYGLGLGLWFGLAAGLGTGITIAIELNRAARGREHYPLWGEGIFSAIRAAAFGAALYRSLGLGFATAFAALITVGQVFGYLRGMRPAMEYAATGKPRLSRSLVGGIAMRTLGYTATALVCSALVRHVDHPLWFAIRVGLVTGVVTGIGGAIIPMIEYYAENLPERRMGAVGIALILCGFALQSFQYWVVVLDVRVT